ncbi:MAG: hypothetical protein H6868_08920 [Rhodospirillales bacterium]|nr:hypothetical protein [Rhodospirillales bacterium]
MQNKQTAGQGCPLKDINFLTWRIHRAKEKAHKHEFDHILSSRPRQRSADVTKH